MLIKIPLGNVSRAPWISNIPCYYPEQLLLFPRSFAFFVVAVFNLKPSIIWQVPSRWLGQLLHYSSETFLSDPPFLFNCTVFCCSLAVLYSSELTLPEPRRGTCLSPPKNLPSESSRPESLCRGDPCLAWSIVLADAIFDPCRKEERFCEAIKSEFSEAAALSSWMVCSSSDSEGRSLKVLSSLPGASREKRRIKWGRPVLSAGLASGQAFFGSAVPLESVTAGLFVEVPLFWFTSASPANNKDEIWIQACEKQPWNNAAFFPLPWDAHFIQNP